MPDCRTGCAADHDATRPCHDSIPYRRTGGYAVCTRPANHCGAHVDRIVTGFRWTDPTNCK